MFLNVSKSNIRTIRPSDDDWFIINGLTISPRAGFEICGNMPYEYQLIINTCIQNQWLKPIAYQPVHEEFMEKLTK